MSEKQFIVQLSSEERAQLEALLHQSRVDARRVLRARMLLKADQAEGGPAWSDEQIAQAFEVGLSTPYRLRQRLVEEGLEAALSPRPRTSRKAGKLDGAAEAQLVATVCSPAPQGHARWSLRLLADELVRLEVVEQLSYETVRRVLKKTNSNPG